MVNVPGSMGISLMPIELVTGSADRPREYTEDTERTRGMRKRWPGFMRFVSGHLFQGTTRTLNEVSVTLAGEVKVNSLVPRLRACFKAVEERVSVRSDLLRVDLREWSG